MSVSDAAQHEQVPDPRLGGDVTSWAQTIRNGYARAFIIFALHQTGVFDALRDRGPLTDGELAGELGLDPDLLRGVLQFLLHSDQVIRKDDGGYSLTGLGREWLYTDQVLAMSFGAVGAYSCLLYELVPTLQREKVFGRDYVRPGDLLARGSYYTGKTNYPWVVSELDLLGVEVVADLGCGAADVLIGFCGLDPKLKGVGVDIAPGALEEAGRRVGAAGLDDRIRLVEGDLTRPETFEDSVKDVGAFNGIMVFHEFLRDGEAAIVEMLERMRKSFPGRYLFMGEFDRMSDEELQEMPLYQRLHPLFYQEVIHGPREQGVLLEKARWLKLFELAGLEVVKVADHFPFRLVEYVLRLP